MTVEEKILKFLKQNRETHTPTKIAQALGINYNLVKMPLHHLMIKGFVKKPVCMGRRNF